MMNNKDSQLILEVSSGAFLGDVGTRRFTECQQAAEQYGFDFGIQLHNSMLAEDLPYLLDFGVRVSAHAPLLSEHGFNLGAEDFSFSQRVFAQNVELFKKISVKEAVFHGFIMSDLPLPVFNRNVPYDKAMGELFRSEMSLDGTSRMCRDFTRTAEYQQRIERVKERLAWLRQHYPEITWYIENDFPAYGSANLFSENAAFLKHPICLDTGHLWATAFLFDRDFHTEVNNFLASCDVGMVHLHASKYTSAIPKLDWGDGHLPLNTPNTMELPQVVKKCREHGTKHFVLEISQVSADDIHAFAKMWNS